MNTHDTPGGPQVGPIAEEAARLVEAALGWAQRAAAAVDPAGDRIATGAPECAGCPVCRAVAALRDPSPELADRLAGVVTEFAGLVAAGLRTVAGDGHGGGGDAGPDGPRHGEPRPGEPRHGEPRPGEPRPGGGGQGTRPRRRSGVEHIDIA